MKNFKNITPFLLSILLVIISFLYLRATHQVKNAKEDLEICQMILEQRNQDIKILNQNYTEIIGKPIDSISIIKTLGGQPVPWRQVYSSEKIYFLFSDISCSDCIISEFKYLKAMPETKQNRIVFLAAYKKPSDLSQIVRVNQIKYPVFIVEQDFSKKMFNTGTPLLFKLNNQDLISRFHICLNDDLTTLQQFFNNLPD